MFEAGAHTSFLGVRHSGRGAVNNEPEMAAFEELLYYYVELTVKI